MGGEKINNMLHELYEQNRLNKYTDWVKANEIVVEHTKKKRKRSGRITYQQKRGSSSARRRKHYGTETPKKQEKWKNE